MLAMFFIQIIAPNDRILKVNLIQVLSKKQKLKKSCYLMMVTQSFDSSLTVQQKENNSNQSTPLIKPRTNWKKEMRKMCVTKPPIRKPSPRLGESIKSKNIPKNVSKVIVQLILQGEYDHYIEINIKDFHAYVKKNKKIQNLNTLIRLTRPHKNEKINSLRKCFRTICWYFLNKQYVNYIFNSKIKDPQWHIQYRSDLLRIFLDSQ